MNIKINKTTKYKLLYQSILKYLEILHKNLNNRNKKKLKNNLFIN